jgi:hypothetical protein
MKQAFKFWRLLTLSVLIMVAVMGCSSNNRVAPMDIDSFSLYSSISAGMPLQKALYYPQGGIIYAMSSTTQQIGIFKDTQRVNVIGGLGTGSGNFQNLSDIAIASDGSLLALDSVSKSIKKFNDSGKPIGVLELKGSVQPTMLAVNTDQSFFVFDAASAEIILYSALDGVEQFRFGKFQLVQVQQLACNRDYVVAYDATEGKSNVFSTLGQYIKTDDGQSLYDDYNNGLNLNDDLLISQMSPASLNIGTGAGLMNISKDTLILVFGEEIRLLRMGYQQVR